MKQSTILLSAAAIVAMSNSIFAQDSIYTQDRTAIAGKIIEISVDEVRYSSLSNPNGPVYVIKKEDVAKIRYSNGTTDIFDPKASIKTEKPQQQIDMSTHYILTMVDGTQLRGKLIRENPSEVVFLDNNFGEKTITRDRIKTLNLEYGDETRVFTLTDGSIITGKIVNKTSESTVVKTNELGVIVIPESKIRQMRELEDAHITEAGKIWFKNPNCTRYLFAPSAIPLKKGEGYYQNIYGAGNAVNFGLNDHISIGGGLAGPVGAYLNTKVGFKLGDMVHVGAGAIVGNGFFPVNGYNLGVGLGFAVVTIGNYDHNITVGSGYGFVNSGGATNRMDKPLFVANGMARLGKKYALVTENWFVNVKGDPFDRGISEASHYETFFSYAFRYMGQKSTLDAGFVNTPGLIAKGWYIGIPYIGFVIRFGNYKEN